MFSRDYVNSYYTRFLEKWEVFFTGFVCQDLRFYGKFVTINRKIPDIDIRQKEEKGREYMNLIAAVDENWAIGRGGRLLVSIPDDMKLFRELTTGKVVVMGRKTLESLPNGQPLRDRVNLVLTRNQDYQAKGVTVVHSMEELDLELEKYASEDIFVIGGASIYEQMVDRCDVAYITKIDFAYTADAYCPDLDKKKEWRLVADSEEQTYFDLEYYYLRYEKVREDGRSDL